MAKTFQDTITVTFKGDGTGLEKTIKDLDRATKALLQTQASMQKQGKRQIRQHTQSQKAMIALDAKLKSLGKRFKDAGVSNQLLTRAYKGNRVALLKVKAATDKYTASLKVNRTGILSTVHDTRILGGSFAVLRSKMLLVSFATSLVGMSIGKLLKLQAEQEKAEKTLSLALGYRSQALLDFASAQQKVTKYGDEETISAMALVGAYTMDEEAIKKVTKASMELASGRGMDLKSAIDMVSKSIFSGTNALTRYGVEIGDATTKEEKLVAITERLTEMYGGQSEQSGTLALATIQLGDSISDVGEKFGALLTPAVMASMTSIKKWTNTIKQEDINNFTKNLVTLTATWYAFRLAVVMSHWEIKKFIVSVTATTFAMKTLQVAMVRTGIGALVVALGFTIQKMLELSGWFDIASKKSRELTDEIEALRKAQIALHAGQLDEATIAKFAKLEEELRKSSQKKTEAFYREVRALKIKNALAITTNVMDRIRIKMGEEWVLKHKDLVTEMGVELGTEKRLLEIKNKRIEVENRASALASHVQSAIANTITMKEEAIRVTIEQLELEKTLMSIQLGENVGAGSDTPDELMQYDAIIEAIKIQKDALIDLSRTKEALMAKSIVEGVKQFQQGTGAYSSFVQGAVDRDLNALKARADYDNASMGKRQSMENAIIRKHQQALRRSAILEKASAVAQATINTYQAVTNAYTTGNIPLSIIIGLMGAAQVANIIATPLAYKQGGLVGGRSHEQGGTMIEAERGEFVMSRSAVESIGTSALNNMNQGGGGGITLNISAPLVDETIIDYIIPAIQKAQRMNLA